MNTHKKTASIKFPVMKNPQQIGLAILCMVFLNMNILAQTKEWKTGTSKDGKITVKYNISKRTAENGQKVPLIEYIATTTDSVSMQNCISLMKDVPKHKEFLDDKISEKVKTISENEWIVYNYTNVAWPFRDTDCVTKMTFLEDPTKKMAVFTFTAAPSEYEDKDVKRSTYYNATYTFKDLGNGIVEIATTAKMTPPYKVPLWMVKSAFPNSVVDVVRKIVKLVKEKE